MSIHKINEDNKQYENIIFEGGGVKGYAYIGAIEALEKLNKIKSLKRFAGSSIGSIFAVLLCLGFTSKELIKHLENLSFSYINNNCGVSNAYKIWNQYGINNITKIKDKLSKIIKCKVDPHTNLKNLYRKTKKDLVIVTCCLNRELPVYLHHSKYPNVTLIDALICSISIPIVFPPQKHKFIDSTEDFYIDGGLVDNYPIWVFNDIDKLYSGKLYDIDKCNIPETTLGIKLLSSNERGNKQVFVGRKKINSIGTFLSAMVNTLSIQIERNIISDSYLQQTININTGEISFIDFEINCDNINKLKKTGYNSVLKYFNNL